MTHKPRRGLRPMCRRNAFRGLTDHLRRRKDVHAYINAVLQHTVCLVKPPRCPRMSWISVRVQYAAFT